MTQKWGQTLRLSSLAHLVDWLVEICDEASAEGRLLLFRQSAVGDRDRQTQCDFRERHKRKANRQLLELSISTLPWCAILSPNKTFAE